MIADDARLTPPRCKKHTGSTGQWVDGSTGQTGRRVNGSTGQWVTFTILYMIADDARLTPPRCKKHTPYDDTRLTPHRCKKHTASFARSTGKFPSYTKAIVFYCKILLLVYTQCILIYYSHYLCTIHCINTEHTCSCVSYAHSNMVLLVIAVSIGR